MYKPASPSTGIFLLNPKQTLQHQLVISAIGFESTFVDLPDVLHQDTILLVRLASLGKQLKEVNIYVKAPLIVRKTDRILFNVENSLSAIGGDGIDALSKAPVVRVNDNGINIAGKNSIKIMVNDKLIQLSGVDLINYFKYGTIDNNHFQSKSYTPEQELLSNYQPVGLSQDERFDIFSSKLDLSLPYKFASLELGAKVSNIKSKNDLVYEPGAYAMVHNNNLFDYKENTQSLYATADKNFNN